MHKGADGSTACTPQRRGDPLILSIASGKGGTGKTLVATSLAHSLGKAVLADCDVEEPNSYLFFPELVEGESRTVYMTIPQVDQERCTRCGVCSDFCAFHALAVLPQEVLLFPELCHGCGGCIIACPEKAISAGSRPIGTVKKAKAGEVDLVWGELNLGEPMSTPLIKEVKEEVSGSTILIDCPPGTACPVIEAVRGSDFCLLVTEPTPFGLHDLDLAVSVLDRLEIPSGVVVNKSGSGDDAIYGYCRDKGLPILLEIPMSRGIAEIYSRGQIFAREMPEWQDCFRELFEKIGEMVR